MSDRFPERFLVNSLRNNGERDESEKALITELDLRGLERGGRLIISEETRFTPLASDFIRDNQIEVVVKKRKKYLEIKSIAIGADHGGFEYKEKLKKYLIQRGFRVYDFGTESEKSVDYPDFAYAVARAVSEKKADVGILIDSAGIGSAIAANKVPGVRAAACYSVVLAKNSREHNGANVLSLGSKQNSFEQVIEIVDAFLTSYLREERHAKRVEKIESIERQYLAK